MRIALTRTYQPLPVDEIAQPLGIMSLDAYLRSKDYSDIHLLDMRLRKESPAEHVDRLLKLKPQLIGLSSLTIEKSCVHELAARIKAQAPHVITVAGGPYATSSRLSLMRDGNVDYAVVGEGEITFHELLEALKSGSDPAKVPGITYRRDHGVHESAPRATIQDLDQLPMPSWDRIDMAAYHRCYTPENMTGRPWAAMSTSRGCPYRCSYCHDVFGKRFRAQSPAKVLEEIEQLYHRHGIREFLLFDDIFNLNKRRLIEICEGIKARGLRINMQFPNGLRADIINRRVLEALKGAGAYRVSYAIESASERIQQSIQKRLKLHRLEQVFKDTDEVGLMMHGFFMLGFPGETRDEIEKTIEFAIRSRLHTAAFFLVTPFEGSELASQYVEPARELHGSDFNFYDNPHQLSEVSPVELRALQRRAYLRFYVDPVRMLRFVSRLPDKRMLLGYARTFARILAGRMRLPGAGSMSFKPFEASVATPADSLELVRRNAPSVRRLATV